MRDHIELLNYNVAQKHGIPLPQLGTRYFNYMDRRGMFITGRLPKESTTISWPEKPFDKNTAKMTRKHTFHTVLRLHCEASSFHFTEYSSIQW